MSNFSISFSYPWLLLLLIPAAALLIFSILRVPRKYRNTRNRVISVILEAIVLLAAILALSGVTINYMTHNLENEIILLVDVSDSEEQAADTRDDFVKTVLDYGGYDGYKIGVVTFGFTQVYAVPMTYDTGSIYDEYKEAPLPDTTATDIAAALEYTRGLFDNPQTGKIVLISDGNETDEEALTAVKNVAAQGTRVDTVFIPSTLGDDEYDIQVTSMTLPDGHISKNTSYTVSVTLQTNLSEPANATVRLYDNGTAVAQTDGDGNSSTDTEVTLTNGINTVPLSFEFGYNGLHDLSVEVASSVDGITANNEYHIYVYLDEYTNVLIIERAHGESDALYALLDADGYTVDILNLYDTEYLPETVDELRMYDQIILNNISNADMNEAYEGMECDLPDLLYKYVHDYGGGLLTTGGEDEYGNVNAYNRSDLYSTLLQSMLPVSAINYTEPTGIMLVFDTSGSMGKGEGSVLEYAVYGALSVVGELQERDYIGIIEFSSSYNVVLGLTSATEQNTIKSAINSVYDNPQSGGTVLAAAIEQAATMLAAESRVQRKHILVISDGDLADTDDTVALGASIADRGISISVVVVAQSSTDRGYNNMVELTDAAGGSSSGSNVYDCRGSNMQNVGNCVIEDLEGVIWDEVNYEDFYPVINEIFSPLVADLDRYYDEESDTYVSTRLNVVLNKFYGTTLKSGATMVLATDYGIPVYAQWSYGEGMVGCLMCDVYGTDSILDGDTGDLFVLNVIANLMPNHDIRPSEIDAYLTEENYINRVSIYGTLEDGEYFAGYVLDSDGNVVASLNEVTEDTENADIYVTTALTASNLYSRATFIVKTPGIYTVLLVKYDAEGNVALNSGGGEVYTEIYKEFPYSEEYNTYDGPSESELMAFMEELAVTTGGAALSGADDLADPYEIFEGFVTALPKMYDPRLILIIVALVVFLLDIAVRKFKFKWPHEIIREHRAKKNNTAGK